jgi:hypothetical protein
VTVGPDSGTLVGVAEGDFAGAFPEAEPGDDSVTSRDLPFEGSVHDSVGEEPAVSCGLDL